MKRKPDPYGRVALAAVEETTTAIQSGVEIHCLRGIVGEMPPRHWTEARIDELGIQPAPWNAG